jgi:hypothetical protein
VKKKEKKHMGNRMYEKLADRNALEKSPIFVFAADHPSGMGIHGLGKADREGRHRTHPEFLQLIREVVNDGYIDAIILAPADAELLAREEQLFKEAPVTPVVRMNAETGIWSPRYGSYQEYPSSPFQTILVDEARYCEALMGTIEHCNVTTGLYSITLNNDVNADERTLSAYMRFAREVGKVEDFHHILEVFPPNRPIREMDSEQTGGYIADSIVRIMSHLVRSQRPLLIKTAYLHKKIWQELTSFNPELNIGALGGSFKDTITTLQLAHDVVHNGGRAVLFGRSIFLEKDPVEFCRVMRKVVDKEVSPEQALDEYRSAV